MTDGQTKVLAWLRTHPGWHRPSQITPPEYPGGPTSVGRILSELLKQGHVLLRSGDRGNGTVCKEYSARIDGRLL